MDIRNNQDVVKPSLNDLDDSEGNLHESSHHVRNLKNLTRIGGRQENPTSSDGDNNIAPEVTRISGQAQDLRKYLIVEPYVLLTCFSFAIRLLVNSELNIQKVCVTQFNFSIDECQAISGHDCYREIQKVATDLTVASTIVSIIPSTVMGVLIASFSDKYGRRVPMIIAPVGSVVEMFAISLTVIFFDSSAWWIVVCNLPSGLTGGLMVAISGAYSYVTGVTTAKSRPFRFALLELMFIVGFTSGTGAGGYIFKHLGFLPIYVVSMLTNATAIVHLYFAMDEPNRKTKTMTYGEIVRAVCSLESIRDSVRTVFREREGNARAQVLLLVLALGLAMIPIIGMGPFAYYYVSTRYDWAVDTYSYVSTVSKILTSMITAVAVELLTRTWHVHHLVVALIGLFSQMFEYMIRGFASDPWLFVVSYAIGCLGNCVSIGIRSRLSCHLDKNEIGKVFVLLTIFELNAPVIATSLFGWIYRSTVDGAIGTSYFVATGMFVPPIAMNIIIIIWGTPPKQQELHESPHADSVHSVSPK